MVGKLGKVRGTTGGGALRSVGRLALWGAIGVIFLRGFATLLAGSEGAAAGASQVGTPAGAVDQQSAAFAVRFARAYLADSSPASLAGLLAPGASLPGGGGPTPPTVHVAQAEAVAAREIGQGEQVVTVACELRNAENFTLAVPIVRDEAGGVAAGGAPAFVSAPGIARTEIERSRTVLGADAGAIHALASKFIETYLSASSAAELEYLTPPDSGLSPLGGFRAAGPVSVRQLGDGGGPSRTVVASVRAGSATGALYPLSYRLGMKREGGRWYVGAIEGEDR